MRSCLQISFYCFQPLKLALRILMPFPAPVRHYQLKGQIVSKLAMDAD